ncbi:hypothetical protein BKA62DRAFT_724113 [Auriculariales sp. MPI-PUGE-AT-0066]|nr:hypothetical protein BKA62DRAFT_724113 [Auriculariales sp. MPI-PUGE-AT-0066]
MCADWPLAQCFIVLELAILSVAPSFGSRRLYKLFLLTKTQIDHDAAEHGWNHTVNSCPSETVLSDPLRLVLYAHKQLLRILL